MRDIDIPFKPVARMILQLGDKLIRNQKIAISELVKNSYDADASIVIIDMNDIDDTEKGEIIIYDNGTGMDIDTIINVWMVPGTDFKENKLKKEELSQKFHRLPIGEKGIGRFGVHKLGNKIELISKKEGKLPVYLNIDWNNFDSNKPLSEELVKIYEKDTSSFFEHGSTGTYIRITKLRNIWSKNDFRSFYRSSMALISPFSSTDNFDIDIHTNLKEWDKDLAKVDDIKEKALWNFKVTTKDGKINTFYYEFKPYPNMKKLQPNIITEKHDLFKHDKNFKTFKEKEFKNINFDGFGDFEIKGYIFDFDPVTLDLSIIEDKTGIKQYLRENGGIRVYRDGMRVYDYGEIGNDWLGLDRKRINAPTAKIGNKLILGSIQLSRKDSKGLIEKTNREGFIENDVYSNFQEAIVFILNKINNLRNNDKDKIRKVYGDIIDLEESTEAVIIEVKKKINNSVPNKDDREKILKDINTIKEHYIHMKEVLLKSAGAGLSYGLIIHEIDKLVTQISNKVTRNSKYDDLKNITSRLKLTIEGISKLFITSKMKKEKINDLLENSLDYFELRGKHHKIDFVHKYKENENFTIKCAENFFINMMLNLMDNSIYWLKYWENDLLSENKPRKIYITTFEEESSVNIIFADSGFGFTTDPEYAILPFKTGRLQNDNDNEKLSMGLGLYFVNEIMKMHNGELRIIKEVDVKRNYNIPEEFLDGAFHILKFYKDN